MKEKYKRECAECGSDNVTYNREDDETICNDCGSVFAELTPEDESAFEEADNLPRKRRN